jgi:hypothetical protein
MNSRYFLSCKALHPLQHDAGLSGRSPDSPSFRQRFTLGKAGLREFVMHGKFPTKRANTPVLV